MTLSTMYASYCDSLAAARTALESLAGQADSLAETALGESRSVAGIAAQLPAVEGGCLPDTSPTGAHLNYFATATRETAQKLAVPTADLVAFAAEARNTARHLAGMAEMLACPSCGQEPPREADQDDGTPPWRRTQEEADAFACRPEVQQATAEAQEADRELAREMAAWEAPPTPDQEKDHDTLEGLPLWHTRGEETLADEEASRRQYEDARTVMQAMFGTTSVALPPQEEAPAPPLAPEPATAPIASVEDDDPSHQRKPARRRKRKGGA